MSLLTAIGSKYETVFVTAAGNDNDIVRDFPARYAMDMPNLLVVGGSTKDGTKLPGSNYGVEIHVYAPGHGMDYPPGWPYDRGPEGVVRTSFGKLKNQSLCCTRWDSQLTSLTAP